VDIDRLCVANVRPAGIIGSPSETDRPISTIHSAPASFKSPFPAPFLIPSTALRDVADEDGDGSATFRKVSVQEKSSPEKNAVSVNVGKTLIFEVDRLIAI
jgi:hypothetical protein